MQRRNAVDVLCVHVEVSALDEQLYGFTARMRSRDPHGVTISLVLTSDIRSVVPDVGQITTREMKRCESLFSRLGVWICGNTINNPDVAQR